MGLRDRYITALVARCAVAPPGECNAQQPATLLRVAPRREPQHATTAPALDAPVLCAPLQATKDATTTQHAQQPDHEAKVERSAIISADGVPAWPNAETVTFEKRVTRSTWLGYPDAKVRAERLLHRDRDADDRSLCVECSHAGPGWRCAKREAFLLDQLQRCPMFKEKP